MIKNKKAEVSGSFIKWVLIGIILIILLISGGILTLAKIGYYSTKIPIWVYILILLAFLFGGKKKR